VCLFNVPVISRDGMVRIIAVSPFLYKWEIGPAALFWESGRDFGWNWDKLFDFLVGATVNAEKLKFTFFIAEEIPKGILVRLIQANDFVLFIE
jgi:hypothetical protein